MQAGGKEGKTMIKRMLATIVCCSLIWTLTGCAPSQEAPSDVLVGKYVVTNSLLANSVCTLKFTDTDLVEIARSTGSNRNSEKFYGTYEIKGHKLTICVSGFSPVDYVLFDEGIIFGRDVSEFCTEDRLSEKSLEVFKKHPFST